MASSPPWPPPTFSPAAAAPLPVSGGHGHHLEEPRNQLRFIHSRSAPEAAACASLEVLSGLQSLCPDRRSCFSSCRLSSDRNRLQNSPDLLGCLKGDLSSPFFPSPNSLRLLSLPAHACRSYPHSEDDYWGGGTYIFPESH